MFLHGARSSTSNTFKLRFVSHSRTIPSPWPSNLVRVYVCALSLHPAFPWTRHLPLIRAILIARSSSLVRRRAAVCVWCIPIGGEGAESSLPASPALRAILRRRDARLQLFVSRSARVRSFPPSTVVPYRNGGERERAGKIEVLRLHAASHTYLRATPDFASVRSPPYAPRKAYTIAAGSVYAIFLSPAQLCSMYI